MAKTTFWKKVGPKYTLKSASETGWGQNILKNILENTLIQIPLFKYPYSNLYKYIFLSYSTISNGQNGHTCGYKKCEYL